MQGSPTSREAATKLGGEARCDRQIFLRTHGRTKVCIQLRATLLGMGGIPFYDQSSWTLGALDETELGVARLSHIILIGLSLSDTRLASWATASFLLLFQASAVKEEAKAVKTVA